MKLKTIALILYKILKKFLKIVAEGVKTKENLKKQMIQVQIKKREKIGFKTVIILIQTLKKEIN